MNDTDFVRLDAIARAIDPTAWDIDGSSIALRPRGIDEDAYRQELFDARAPRRRRARQAAKRVVAVLAQGSA